MTDRLGYGAAEDRTMPAVTYALYLLAFATGVTAIIGVVIAHLQQNSAGPVMRSHYTFLVRTFWLGLLFAFLGGVIGAVLFAIGAVLSVILIGIPIMALAGVVWGLTAIWYAIRCIVGVIYLARGEAYPRPYALLA